VDKCLVAICKEFETLDNYLLNRSEKNLKKINKLFFEFIECYSNLKEEKLQYPKEFAKDVKLYKEGNITLVEKFEDTDIRYMMLSDFYDYVRITKKYSNSEYKINK
jgi:hypothetical protein